MYNDLTENELTNLIIEDKYIIFEIPDELITRNMCREYILAHNSFNNYKLKKFLLDNELIKSILDISYTYYELFDPYFDNNQKNYYFKYIENKISNIKLDSPSLFRKSPIVALSVIKNDINKFNMFLSDAITDEVAKEAIKLGFKYNKYDTNSNILTNEILVLHLLKDDVQILENASGNGITKKTVNYALDHGFIFSTNSRLLRNKQFILEIIKRNPDYLNCINEEIIDSDIINCAVNSGFCYRFIGERESYKPLYFKETWSDNIEYVTNNNTFLLKYPELVLSSYNNGYNDIIFEEVIDENNPYMEYILNNSISKNVDINIFRNIKLLNNTKVKEFIMNKYFQSQNSKILFEKYLNIFPNEKYLLSINNLSVILNNLFTSIFNENEIYLIIKFILIPEPEFPLYRVIKNNLPNILKEILNKFDNENIVRYKVKDFRDLIYYLDKNNLIIDNNTNAKNLKFVVDSNENYNSNNHINNLHEIRYLSIKNRNDIKIKDKILIYLCGSNFEEVNQFLKQIFSTSKIKLLSNKEINNDYSTFLKLIENVVNINDEDTLNAIYTNIKTYNHYSLKELKEWVVKIFYNEYKLTNINNLKINHYIDGVPITILDDEEYSFLIHATNAFNLDYISKYDINDYINGEIGKSFICTSYINNIHMSTAASQDGIKIILDEFSPEQLFLMADYGVKSTGNNDNSLNITYKRNNWLPPFYMSCISKSFNELTMYYQDNNAKRLKIKGLLFEEDLSSIPKNLILIAKKYNLRIVIANNKKNLNNNLKKIELYKKECLCGDLKNLKSLFGLLYKYDINLTNFELDTIISHVTKEELNDIILELEFFNYKPDAIKCLKKTIKNK